VFWYYREDWGYKKVRKSFFLIFLNFRVMRSVSKLWLISLLWWRRRGKCLMILRLILIVLKIIFRRPRKTWWRRRKIINRVEKYLLLCIYDRDYVALLYCHLSYWESYALLLLLKLLREIKLNEFIFYINKLSVLIL
jgi:hypothetical protein